MKKYLVLLWLLISTSAFSQSRPDFRIKISIDNNVNDSFSSEGRLIVFFSKKESPQPIFQSTFTAGRVGFAMNVANWQKGEPFLFDTKKAFYSRDNNSVDLNNGEWFIQVVYNISGKAEFIEPGNLFSKAAKIDISGKNDIQVELSEIVKPRRSSEPVNTEWVKYVEIESKCLSEFWGKPMKIRASVFLPRNFEQNKNKKYPVRVNIGGYGSSWTRTSRIESDKTFLSWWLSEEAPEIISIFPDGEGPLGDPYYIDSENSGPYGKALTEELIPFIEKEYRGMVDPNYRFVEGCSTGGWVSLALQIFYPDYFNGAWSFSADPVDFHHLQLINLYDGENAFYNEFGYLMPSVRSKTGQPRLSIKDEVAGENLQSFDNSYTTSGGQWGAWNALYSPKANDGKPAAAFDPITGAIDKTVAEHWKKYDLLQVLESNWSVIGPKLKGKLWIWMGDMDDFYLNNAMRELEKFMKSTTNPASDAQFNFEPTKGHCQEYNQRKVLEMMQEKIKKIK